MADVLDQSQSGNNVIAGFGEYSGVRYRGQGFTPSASPLSAISFNLSSVGSKGLKVFFYAADSDSLPIGSELYSFVINNGSLATGLHKYTLPSPLTLTVGSQYCIYFAPWDTTSNTYSDDYRNLNWSDANTYSSGKGIVNDNGAWFAHGATLLDIVPLVDLGLLDLLSVLDLGPLDLQFETYSGSTAIVTPSAISYSDTRVSKSSASRYQFLLYLNGLLFADITGIVESRSFTITRNRPDEINFAVDIDKLDDLARRLNTNTQDLLQIGVSEIRVVRNGVVLTAGQLMSFDADLGEKRSISVHAMGWLELFKYRLTSSIYSSTTALSIVTNELSVTQTRPFGSFGVTLGTYPSPDMTNSYASKEYDNKSLYDLFVELSEEQGGFDFEVTWDKKLNIYTQIGIQRPEILLTYPGNVKNVRISKDSSRLVNALTARGKGYGDIQNTVSVSNTDSQQLYAIRESTVDFSDIEDPTQLTNLATSELNTYKQPLVVHEVSFNGGPENGAPEIGSFHVGDQVPIFVKVLRLYEDVDQYFRIDKIAVTIDNEDQEDVTISFTQPG